MTGEAEAAARGETRSRRIHKSPTAASKNAAAERQANRQQAGANRLALSAAAHAEVRLRPTRRTASPSSRFTTPSPAAAARRCKASRSTAAKCRTLRLSFWVRGDNIRPGQQAGPVAARRRHVLRRAPRSRSAKNRSAHSTARSTGDEEAKSLRVPLRAREAILRIGLLGRRRRTCRSTTCDCKRSDDRDVAQCTLVAARRALVARVKLADRGICLLGTRYAGIFRQFRLTGPQRLAKSDNFSQLT